MPEWLEVVEGEHQAQIAVEEAESESSEEPVRDREPILADRDFDPLAQRLGAPVVKGLLRAGFINRSKYLAPPDTDLEGRPVIEMSDHHRETDIPRAFRLLELLNAARPVFIGAKDSYWKMNVGPLNVGRFFEVFAGYPVSRGNLYPETNAEFHRKADEHLAERRSGILFNHTRLPVDDLRVPKFKAGGLEMAQRSRVPILPVAHVYVPRQEIAIPRGDKNPIRYRRFDAVSAAGPMMEAPPEGVDDLTEWIWAVTLTVQILKNQAAEQAGLEPTYRPPEGFDPRAYQLETSR